MVYVADLAPVLGEAARVLVAGGTLAFTVETHAGNNGGENGSGVVLGDGLRYAHSVAYVRAAIEAAGLKLAHCEESSIRNEANVPVRSLVVVATKG
jgi:predicted TPR repeat methyltransferase